MTPPDEPQITPEFFRTFQERFNGDSEVFSAYTERDKVIAKNLKARRTNAALDTAKIDYQEYLQWCTHASEDPNDFETFLKFICSKNL